MTSAHEYTTNFVNQLGHTIYKVRQHNYIATKWDFVELLELPISTMVYSWGYDGDDEEWSDDTEIPINEFLYRIGGVQYLLKDMDVPSDRIRDLDWLRRNLGIHNSGHPNYQRVMDILDAYFCYYKVKP